MTLKYPLVHVDDVQPENMKKGEGWAISEFRLPISGQHGSSTTVFHSIFRPGSTHAKHLHSRCDEIAVYLKGHGVVGQSAERTEVRPGHCRRMPSGIGALLLQRDEGRGRARHRLLRRREGRRGHGLRVPRQRDRGGHQDAAPRMDCSEGTLVHIDDVKPSRMNAAAGWNITDFRVPIGRHNGSDNMLFWAKFLPGASQPEAPPRELREGLLRHPRPRPGGRGPGSRRSPRRPRPPHSQGRGALPLQPERDRAAGGDGGLHRCGQPGGSRLRRYGRSDGGGPAAPGTG